MFSISEKDSTPAVLSQVYRAPVRQELEQSNSREDGQVKKVDDHVVGLDYNDFAAQEEDDDEGWFTSVESKRLSLKM